MRTLLVYKTGCTVRQFKERDDSHVGILESAALVWALSTFHDLVKGAAVTAHRQSSGSRSSCAGGSTCPQQNNMIAQMWLHMAEECIAGTFPS